MAARLVCAVGARSIVASAAGAVFAVVSVPFVMRIGHVALSSHFLLLWALALHFESVRRRRAKLGESCMLLVVALMVHAYLFTMVLMIETATLAALGSRRHLTRRDLGQSAAGLTTEIGRASCRERVL